MLAVPREKPCTESTCRRRQQTLENRLLEQSLDYRIHHYPSGHVPITFTVILHQPATGEQRQSFIHHHSCPHIVRTQFGHLHPEAVTALGSLHAVAVGTQLEAHYLK